MNQSFLGSIFTIYRLAFFLSILIFINILFGPLVRATDSGLACPDWPLCHGKVIPPPEFRIWMEVGHRIYSSIIGFVILALAFLILKNIELRNRFATLTIASILVLVNQVLLGKLTVTKLLNPETVNLHLLNAVLLFTLIVTITTKASFILETSTQELHILKWREIFSRENRLLSITTLFIAIQLVLGGMVSSHYAGLACNDYWPTCNGEWFPKMEGLVLYHVLHRYMAYIVVIHVILVFTKSIFKPEEENTRFFIKLSLYAVGIQFILGVCNVLFQLPKIITALHTGMGVLLFILMYNALYNKLLFRDNSL